MSWLLALSIAISDTCVAMSLPSSPTASRSLPEAKAERQPLGRDAKNSAKHTHTKKANAKEKRHKQNPDAHRT